MKNFFSRARWISRQIEADEAHIERLRRAAEETGAAIACRDGGNGGDPRDFSEIIGRVIDYENSLENRRREKVDALRRIDAVIGELTDDRLALLLTLRYRDMKSWGEVAEAMGYTPRQTLRLHRDALDAAKNAIENETCHTMSHTTVIS